MHMSSPTGSRSFQNIALIAVISLIAGGQRSPASPVYWGETSYVSGTTYKGTVATAENWFTDPAGTTVAPIAPDTLDDDLVFNTTPANMVGGEVRVDVNFSANSFTFNTSGPTVLSQTANRTIILGGGGITLNAPSGPVTFGVSVNTLNVRLAASQAWINHSASPLSVRNVSTSVGAGPVVLLLNAAGSGNIVLPLSIADTLDDPLSIVVDSAGSGSITMGPTRYSGGTTINRGKLSTSGTSDTGEILLGATSDAFDATLTVNSAKFPNNITVRSGSVGRKSLLTSHPDGALDGTIALNDTLTLVVNGKLTTLNGVVSGPGSLIKTGKGELILTGANTFAGNLMVEAGSLSLAEAGSLTFSIGTHGVNNQVKGESSCTATFNGTFDFKISDDSLVEGNSWSLIMISNRTFGPTFSITGFTEADDVWSNGSGLTFSESTGILTYKRNP